MAVPGVWGHWGRVGREVMKGIFLWMANILSVTDVVVSAKCLGIGSFHYKWQLQVVVIPLVLLIGPVVLWLINRRTDAEAALLSLTKQAFFVCFFVYPHICRYS
eukprot:COSAG06_NODE_5759_length_3288_cov_52.533082_2_plen_104_part_00